MKIRFIINKNASKFGFLKVIQIKKTLKNQDIEYDLFVTKNRKQGFSKAKEASENGYSMVVACGGDGTVNCVINAIKGTNTKIGIINIGSTNQIALHAKIPRNIKKAVEIILRGKTKKYDLGKIGRHYFISNAGIGLDAKIVMDTSKSRFFRYFDYAVPFTFYGLKNFLMYDKKIKISVPGGEDKEVYTVLVNNIKKYARYFTPTPYSECDDGMLDIIILKKKPSFVQAVMLMNSMRKGKHINNPQIEYFKAEKLSFSSEKDIYVQIDGDCVGKLPMDLEVSPKAIELVV